MASPATDPTGDRLAELERQVADLRRRLAALEGRLQQTRPSGTLPPRQEHPLDRDTVQEKVVYDWQS
ncbi:MAG: hypothetical protein L3J86_02720 [Thermoplasmata archaeon]|nr:hypothetical protein [Thermoplasmata archaeon]